MNLIELRGDDELWARRAPTTTDSLLESAALDRLQAPVPLRLALNLPSLGLTLVGIIGKNLGKLAKQSMWKRMPARLATMGVTQG